MKIRLVHLMTSASLVGMSFLALAPFGSAQCTVDPWGGCYHGCRYTINLGVCSGKKCDGLVNAQKCHNHAELCNGDLASQILPCADTSDHWLPNCPHSSPHSHTYVMGGSVGGRSDTASTGDSGMGIALAGDHNLVDCDGDYDPLNPDTETADFDGDYEFGVGGGFFGFGPWAHEPVCDFALTQHGAVVTVNDLVWGSAVAFVVGADDTNGPDLTPDLLTGEPSCTTDGTISPGDPSTDPTADADDCLSDPYVGSGATCGAGGDGGYWVFLSGAEVTQNGSDPVTGTVGVSNAPTSGTLTA